jgi:hypothetical protein
MQSGETRHAENRRCEREIKEAWIILCKCKGVRTNIPPQDMHGTWRHKHMYHGLHVVSEARSGVVITAFWAGDDADNISHCKDFYAREVLRRNEAAVVAKNSVNTRQRVGKKGVNRNKNGDCSV